MSDFVHIARCPEHGLHGERSECFICQGPVEQVPVVRLEQTMAIAHPDKHIVRLVTPISLHLLPEILGKFEELGFTHLAPTVTADEDPQIGTERKP